jgi:hypothetical protein
MYRTVAEAASRQARTSGAMRCAASISAAVEASWMVRRSVPASNR